ncbi:hypothetical protein KR054_002500 [Drosophila jambulina]|nr:hypothetical protein KR054_002500 [Drosophila jambulina]
MPGIAFAILVCLIASTQAAFPDDPQPCKYGDSECIAKFANSLFSKRSGEEDPSLNLWQLDPMKVDKMVINQGGNSAVNIKLTFTDNLLYGIKDQRVVGVKGFGKNLTEQHELKVLAKSYSLVGPYNIQGKVLILPISGSGISNMSMSNIKMIVRFSGQPLEKDGETYLDVTNVKLTLKPAATSYLFTNLFNGDKALGDNMNLFLNENADAIYQETSQSTDRAFSQLFYRLVKGVFAHRPYAKMFAGE